MRHRVVDYSDIFMRFILSMGGLWVVVIPLAKFYAYLCTQLPFLGTAFPDWLAKQNLGSILSSEGSLAIFVLSVFIAARSGRYIFNSATGTFTFPNYLRMKMRMKTIRMQDIDDITSVDRTTRSTHSGSSNRMYFLEFRHSGGSEALQFFSRKKRHQVAELFRQAGKEVTVRKGLHSTAGIRGIGRAKKPPS